MYPWVYYLLGGTRQQLATYHGQQTRRTMCADSGRRVYMYPAQYLSYGMMGTANLTTDPTGGKQYVVADHLGSVRSAIKESGAVVATSDYTPFGEVQAVTGTPGRKGFIDKETDAETSEENF